MHRHDASTEALTQAIVRYAVERIRMDPPTLDGPRPLRELEAMVGNTVTEHGFGGLEALRIFTESLAPSCISIDHPRYLSFIPAAPTEAAILFDLVVGASSIYGGSWLEGSGAIYAENQALRWIADLAGLPPEAGGTFVSGGTAGNLSALIAARWRWRRDADGRHDRTRGLIVTSTGAHSSVAQAATAMDVDVALVDDTPRDGDQVIPGQRQGVGRLEAEPLAEVIEQMDDADRERIFAIVATAGTTNAGIIDDLAGAADVAERYGTWLHVDGAYGLAALAAPSVRDLFAGIERADSLIVDPHKWLFAPYDSCALLYRDPEIGRLAHTQQAEYLEVMHTPLSTTPTTGAHGHGDGEIDISDDAPVTEWNSSDYGHHLSRRARGLPLWFSLATHGTAAYTEAVESTLNVAREAAGMLRAAEHIDVLVVSSLSVVVFRRIGWGPDDYKAWSDRMLREQEAFIMPTKWQGETVMRICIVNPQTTTDDIAAVIDAMR